MTNYFDADKLIAKIKKLNLATKTYEEQVAFNNALAMVVEIITSLQQEQTEVKLSADIKMEWDSFNKHIAEYGEDVVWLNWNSFVDIATYFYELGQREMRNRITNPEYNKQVVDKMKSEYPIAANEEELKKAIKERYPMPEDADAHTRDRIAAARNGFLSGYSYELGRKEGSK